MSIDIFLREPARPEQKFEPWFMPTFGTGFGTAQQITLSHDAEKLPLLIDDRQSANRLLKKSLAFSDEA